MQTMLKRIFVQSVKTASLLHDQDCSKWHFGSDWPTGCKARRLSAPGGGRGRTWKVVGGGDPECLGGGVGQSSVVDKVWAGGQFQLCGAWTRSGTEVPRKKREVEGHITD